MRAGLEGGAVGGELVGDGLGVFEGGGEGGDLLDFLVGEGEPASDLRVEGGLAFEGERDVHEAARGRDDEAVVADARAELLEQRERGVEVVDPDVAAVDDAGDEVLAAGEAVLADELGVALAPMEVEADGGDGEGGEGVVGLVDVAEVGLDEELRLASSGGERLVGRADGFELGGGAVLDERRARRTVPTARLRRAGGRAPRGRPRGVRGAARGGRSFVSVAVVATALAEQQVGDRAEEDGDGLDARRAGLAVFI